jgi:hypothetical protein
MAGGATYKTLIDAVEEYLKESGSISRDKSKSNKEIVDAIKKRIAQGLLNIDVTEGTMLSYLSDAANNDADSPIVSGGPRRGYWYEEITAPSEKPVESEEVKAETGKAISIVEKDLYPLMELWLQQKGFTSKDLSTLKSGGPWGNPDIIGAQRVELFGAVQIELASCEVKLREANWERDIFEAISHKRFSNRSWFCYRVDNDEVPLPKGMEYYAERYRVGVVQIILDDTELIALKQGRKVPLDFIERVTERVPALYDYVPLREQRDLIERSGITLALSF